MLVAHLTLRRHLVAWIGECVSLLETIHDPALRRTVLAKQRAFERDLAQHDN